MALLREHHPARALPLRLASSGRVLQGPSGSLAGPLARHRLCDSSGVTPVCHATAQWQAFMLEYPHVRYTDVDDFICKKSGDGSLRARWRWRKTTVLSLPAHTGVRLCKQSEALFECPEQPSEPAISSRLPVWAHPVLSWLHNSRSLTVQKKLSKSV